MTKDLEKKTEEVFLKAITRRILIEKYNIRNTKKEAGELYANGVDTEEEYKQLDLYFNILQPYLTQNEREAFSSRLFDLWLQVG